MELLWNSSCSTVNEERCYHGRLLDVEILQNIYKLSSSACFFLFKLHVGCLLPCNCLTSKVMAASFWMQSVFVCVSALLMFFKQPFFCILLFDAVISVSAAFVTHKTLFSSEVFLPNETCSRVCSTIDETLTVGLPLELTPDLSHLHLEVWFRESWWSWIRNSPSGLLGDPSATLTVIHFLSFTCLTACDDSVFCWEQLKRLRI